MLDRLASCGVRIDDTRSRRVRLNWKNVCSEWKRAVSVWNGVRTALLTRPIDCTSARSLA